MNEKSESTNPVKAPISKMNLMRMITSLMGSKLGRGPEDLLRPPTEPVVTGQSSNLYSKVGSGKRRRRRNRHK